MGGRRRTWDVKFYTWTDLTITTPAFNDWMLFLTLAMMHGVGDECYVRVRLCPGGRCSLPQK